MVTFPYLSILPFPSLLICTVAATHTPPSASASYLGIFASSRSGDRHTLSQASLCPTPHHALGFLQRSAHPWRFFPSRRTQTAHLRNLCTRSIHHPFHSGRRAVRDLSHFFGGLLGSPAMWNLWNRDYLCLPPPQTKVSERNCRLRTLAHLPSLLQHLHLRVYILCEDFV